MSESQAEYRTTEHVETIHFIVKGIPRPKQSFKYSKTGGYTPIEVVVWQSKVSSEAMKTIAEYDWTLTPFRIWKTPLAVELDFYLPDKHRRDLDNLSKAVLDAMNGIVYKDDCQVVDLHLRKFYNSPEYGVTVTVALAKKEE